MKHFKQIATALVVVLFAAYFMLNVDKFRPLLHINVYLLLLIAIADFASIVANGFFIKFVLQPFDKLISITESTYVSLISAVGNFFAPIGGGFGFRAIYLKKKHGLAYSDYIATLYGNYIIVFLVNSFFALLALYMLRGRQNSQYIVLVGLFSAIFVASLLLTLIKMPVINKKLNIKNRFTRMLVSSLFQMIGGWGRVVKNKRLLTQLIGVICFNFLISILITKLEVSALHLTITVPTLILFSVLGFLSLFVNITPANIGIKEAIYLFSASVIGFSTSQILSIALIDRGVLFMILLISWLVSSRAKKTKNLL